MGAQNARGNQGSGTTMYRFRPWIARFLDYSDVVHSEDEIVKMVQYWCDKVGIEQRISPFFYYISLGTRDPASKVVQIKFPPEASEAYVACVIGHISLGQKTDACFAQCVFEGCEELDSPAFARFMGETAVSQGFSDLFVDDHLVRSNPEFVSDMIERNISCLTEIVENDDAWMLCDPFAEGTCIQAVAIGVSALESMGMKDQAYPGKTLNRICREIDANLGSKDGEKVHQLLELYRGLPELPEGRYDAVRLLERVTQVAAEILDFTIPVLRYSETHDWHYWAKP